MVGNQTLSPMAGEYKPQIERERELTNAVLSATPLGVQRVRAQFQARAVQCRGTSMIGLLPCFMYREKRVDTTCALPWGAQLETPTLATAP